MINICTYIQVDADEVASELAREPYDAAEFFDRFTKEASSEDIIKEIARLLDNGEKVAAWLRQLAAAIEAEANQ